MDGCTDGKRATKSLEDTLYAGKKELILTTDEFVGDLEVRETEDLCPSSLLIEVIDRVERRAEREFEEEHDNSKPIVPQIKNWAAQEKFALPNDWKVQLALGVKSKLLRNPEKYVNEDILERWTKMFERFLS